MTKSMKDALLDRAAILGASDLPSEDVPVPAWGGAVRVRGLTAAERDQFEAQIVGKDGKVKTENLRARLVALCVVDGEGKRMFTEKDIVALSGKSAQAMDKLFAAAQKLSGMSRQDVEELEKNSGAAMTEGSPSD